MGEWLSRNGEAIYGSRVYKFSCEGPTLTAGGQFTDKKKIEYTPGDFRFTQNDGCVFAMALKCAENGEYLIKSFATEKDAASSGGFSGIISKVTVLGDNSEAEYKRDEEGLHIRTQYRSDLPVVFKIEVL